MHYIGIHSGKFKSFLFSDAPLLWVQWMRKHPCYSKLARMLCCLLFLFIFIDFQKEKRVSKVVLVQGKYSKHLCFKIHNGAPDFAIFSYLTDAQCYPRKEYVLRVLSYVIFCLFSLDFLWDYFHTKVEKNLAS